MNYLKSLLFVSTLILFPIETTLADEIQVRGAAATISPTGAYQSVSVEATLYNTNLNGSLRLQVSPTFNEKGLVNSLTIELNNNLINNHPVDNIVSPPILNTPIINNPAPLNGLE